jgi:hypothetical protein
MKSNRFSLFNLDKQSIVEFDKSCYSLLKFGYFESIKFYSELIFKKLIDLNKNGDLKIDNCVFILGPYQFIDTAASLVMKKVIELMNDHANKTSDFSPVKVSKIDRKTTYFTDYSMMDKNARYDLIKNDQFILNFNEIENFDVIVFDDIRITGTHETIIENLFQKFQYQKTINYFFIAQINQDHFNASVEHYLNTFTVKTPFDLLIYLKNNQLIFTTRAVKFILSLNAFDFSIFLRNLSDNHRVELYNLAIGNQYDKNKDIVQNINSLKSL